MSCEPTKSENVYLAAVYLRKSRKDDQNEDVSATIRRHKETLIDFAIAHDINIYGFYEEVRSGDSLYARPEMLRLLEDAEAKKFNSVLCMDIDRLGRGSMSDQGMVLDTFKFSGITIITPRKIYDLNNELDEEYTEFETFMARRELKTITRRLQRGIQKSIEEGSYLANAPYGYEKVTIDKTPTLQIKEDEAVFVRMIYDMYVNQHVGCTIIADTISALGAKPHRAERFTRTSIRHILRNPTFCGKVVWNQKKQIKKGSKGNAKHITIYNPKEEWTIVDGKHPAIIDEDTYNRAQEILSGRYHKPYYTGVVKNPLAGLLYCSKCGRLMQRRPFVKKGGEEHMICTTKGCCKSSRMDRVIDSVLNAIKMELNCFRSRLNNNTPSKAREDYSSAIAAEEKELNTIKTQRERLHDLLEQGVYDNDTFLERMSILQERSAEHVDAMNALLKKQSEIKVVDYAATIHRIESALQAYYVAEEEERNSILKEILQSATYYKEKGWKPDQFMVSVNLIRIYET